MNEQNNLPNPNVVNNTPVMPQVPTSQAVQPTAEVATGTPIQTASQTVIQPMPQDASQEVASNQAITPQINEIYSPLDKGKVEKNKELDLTSTLAKVIGTIVCLILFTIILVLIAKKFFVLQ